MGVAYSSPMGGEQPTKRRSRDSERRPLVVLGSMAVDTVLSVDRPPMRGETVCATECEVFPGGKGANQAAAAALLGYPTLFIGQFGLDANGDLMRRAMVECKVDLSLSRTVDYSTGQGMIMLEPDGENSIVITAGANRAPWELTEEIKQAIRGCGILMLQREIPEEVNIEAAQIAQRAGVPVVLDAGGMEGHISEELLACTTVISPNETELARMTDMPTSTSEEVHAAATALLDRGVEAVLLKLGAKGSVLLRRAGMPPVVQEAIPVKEVIDTTAAGDCYTASWAVASLEDRSSAESMLFASVAAAICVQRKGAMTSLPFAEEVLGLLKKIQLR